MAAKNKNYLGRGIHNQNKLDSLMTGNLNKMLEVIKLDNELDIQIRENYLNIYYKGGNIARINSENSIELDKFYFYLGDKPKIEIQEDKNIVDELTKLRDQLIGKFKKLNYSEFFCEAKIVMDKWFTKHPKPERMEQHELSIKNQYGKSDYTIIDLEYQVSTLSDFACTCIPTGKDKPKNPRFDIIAINKQGKLCVIELKKGTKALENSSGMKDHWDCYQQSIGRNHLAFMNEMKNVLEQKQAFNLIDKQIKIVSPVPEFMFAYAYDDSDLTKQDSLFQNAYNKIGVPIHVIKLKDGSKKLMN